MNQLLYDTQRHVMNYIPIESNQKSMNQAFLETQVMHMNQI